MSGISMTQDKNSYYVIINKKYNIKAVTEKKEIKKKFINQIGGNIKKDFIIKKVSKEELSIDPTIIRNLNLYKYYNEDFYLNYEIELDMEEIMLTKEADIAGCFIELDSLMDYYKFSNKEKEIVSRFINAHNNYIKDSYGYSMYELRECIDIHEMFKIFLNSKIRNMK